MLAATLGHAKPDRAFSARAVVVDDTGRVLRIVYCPT
jgi:hypothetical protein